MSTPTTQEEVKKELEDYLDAKVRIIMRHAVLWGVGRGLWAAQTDQ
jgi:hypothetical protein